MRISDWSSDVCSSDLIDLCAAVGDVDRRKLYLRLITSRRGLVGGIGVDVEHLPVRQRHVEIGAGRIGATVRQAVDGRASRHRRVPVAHLRVIDAHGRSEEHTSELQSLMRISYAVFCLKKKKTLLHK